MWQDMGSYCGKVVYDYEGGFGMWMAISAGLACLMLIGALILRWSRKQMELFYARTRAHMDYRWVTTCMSAYADSEILDGLEAEVSEKRAQMDEAVRDGLASLLSDARLELEKSSCILATVSRIFGETEDPDLTLTEYGEVIQNCQKIYRSIRRVNTDMAAIRDTLGRY